MIERYAAQQAALRAAFCAAGLLLKLSCTLCADTKPAALCAEHFAAQHHP